MQSTYVRSTGSSNREGDGMSRSSLLICACRRRKGAISVILGQHPVVNCGEARLKTERPLGGQRNPWLTNGMGGITVR